MMQTNPQHRIMTWRSIDTVRVTVAVFGVYAGLLGIEHGYFATLQGNVVPKALKIMAVSGSELPFPFGHEPAMTLVPNFFVTGILAILVGLSISYGPMRLFTRSVASRFCHCSLSFFCWSAEDSDLLRS